MNFIKLKQIIDADSANATRTDLQIVQSLNTRTKTVMQSKILTARGIMKTLGASAGSQLLDDLETLSNDNSSMLSKPIKWIMRDIASGGVDISDAETQNMLAALVANNTMTQAQADALTNTAKSNILEISEAGFTHVTIADVVRAKGVA